MMWCLVLHWLYRYYLFVYIYIQITMCICWMLLVSINCLTHVLVVKGSTVWKGSGIHIKSVKSNLSNTKKSHKSLLLTVYWSSSCFTNFWHWGKICAWSSQANKRHNASITFPHTHGVFPSANSHHLPTKKKSTKKYQCILVFQNGRWIFIYVYTVFYIYIHIFSAQLANRTWIHQFPMPVLNFEF